MPIITNNNDDDDDDDSNYINNNALYIFLTFQLTSSALCALDAAATLSYSASLIVLL